MTPLKFTHVHIPPTSDDARTMLLLHGTGGNERDLLELGSSVAPGARLLGVRGQVLESGMPRFFRRLAEGVFDDADIVVRAADLATFVATASEEYGFDSEQVVAVGYSNGANIAAAVMLLHPGTFRAAVLLRSMVPLVPAALPNLAGTEVLMSQGQSDPIVPRPAAERLAELLRNSGADVTLHWEDVGHGLSSADVDVAREWLAARR